MKTIRLLLFFVFAGMIGSLYGQTNTNPLTVYITYFNTHVQNYAVVDLSGTNAATNVNLIALDDGNNIAFGYTNAAETAYNVFTWANGGLTTQTPLSLSQADGSVTDTLSPLAILPNGELYGSYSFINAIYLTDTYIFSSAGGVFNKLGLPPPYSLASLYFQENFIFGGLASDGTYAASFHYGVLGTYTKAANPYDAYDLSDSTYETGIFIATAAEYITGVVVHGSNAVAFDFQESGGGGPAAYGLAKATGPFSSNGVTTMINSSEFFQPTAINTNGWAVGAGSASLALGNGNQWYTTTNLAYQSTETSQRNEVDTIGSNSYTNPYAGTQIWDGSALHNLNGSYGNYTNNDIPLNLNNQNLVIVQGLDTNWNDTEGYLWQEVLVTNSGVVTTNVGTTLFKSLIHSTNVQAQIQNIEPFAVSNIQQTSSGSPTNLPILNILCTANVRTYAGLTTVINDKTNSQPSITNNEIVLFSQYADQTWHFKQVLGLDNPNIQAINYNGLITAIGDTNSSTLQKPLLAIPVSLSNIDDPTIRNGGNGTNNIDITFMTNPGIPPNSNVRDTNINCVAWIAGNDPTNNYAPRMPWLQAQAGGFTNVNTYWKLQVAFHDRYGNPHRDFDTGDTNDSNTNIIAQAHDVVTIPYITTNANYVNGWRLVTNGAWNIYQDPDFLAELATNGFFGGDATLSLMISNPSSGGTILPPQNFCFRIAGENPNTNLCKTYITNNCGQYWYAYAIAKEETEGDGSYHYYNHFMDNGGMLTNHAAPWPGHEGRTSWNDDGIKDATTGSGGYGLMQQTYGTSESNYIMPRSWIWNWQANLAGFTNEIYSKEVDYVTNNGIVTNMAIAPRKYNILVGWNPTLATHIWCPAKGAKRGAFSSYQTVLIGVYNGNKGFSRVHPNDNLYPKGIKSPWDSQWKLTATYPPKVANKLETNTPSQ